MIPATRALSSTAVQSASKAVLEGNPNPKDTPRRPLASKEKVTLFISNWRKIANDPVTTIARIMENKRRVLRFIRSLMTLPMKAATTLKANMLASAKKVQKKSPVRAEKRSTK
jgi:hypothetical protein